MLRNYVRPLAIILFLLGLSGFFQPQFWGVFQLDLWQSFVYLIGGAVGLKLSLAPQTEIKYLKNYATTTGIIGLIFVLFGLTFPNFFDIFHFEPGETALHLVMGVYGCIIGDLKE
ncbi:MAG: hypothetical protein HY973_01175 [Candidatus Kerfeldbacteria bacterium]|nr:hypothetical protein [Candidatus Kerfeldbacteria bacterium]